MKFQPRSCVTALLACVAAAGLAPAAKAMTVQPVVIDLTTSGRSMSQVVTVENSFDKPLPVELRIETLDLTADGAKPTGDGQQCQEGPDLLEPGCRSRNGRQSGLSGGLHVPAE